MKDSGYCSLEKEVLMCSNSSFGRMCLKGLDSKNSKRQARVPLIGNPMGRPNFVRSKCYYI